MQNDSPVLVGTDLSDGAQVALEQGAAWAKREGAPLVVAHIAPAHAFPTLNVPRLASALEERFQKQAGLDVQCIIESGSGHAGLVELADKRGARLVVVGASGESELSQALLGSTAESVVRYAHCPVLVARPSRESAPIVVATDFSETAKVALELGVRQARTRGVDLVLMHSMHQVHLPLDLFGPLGVSAPEPSTEDVLAVGQAAKDTLSSLLAASGVEGKTLLVTEPIASALAQLSEDGGASVVVVGTHGRTGLRRMAMGSVAEKVVRRALCSVLVAR